MIVSKIELILCIYFIMLCYLPWNSTVSQSKLFLLNFVTAKISGYKTFHFNWPVFGHYCMAFIMWWDWPVRRETNRVPHNTISSKNRGFDTSLLFSSAECGDCHWSLCTISSQKWVNRLIYCEDETRDSQKLIVRNVLIRFVCIQK